jgi:hypothetical protein
MTGDTRIKHSVTVMPALDMEMWSSVGLVCE